MKAHSVFNMVLLHPDVNNTSESWTSKGSKKEMLEFYKGWSPSESSPGVSSLEEADSHAQLSSDSCHS